MLSGCDTVAAICGVGKTTAVAMARGMALMEIGKLESNFEDIEKMGHTVYGCLLQIQAMFLNDTIQLCTLPPTNEACYQNVLRAHIHVVYWYASLAEDPPPLNPGESKWEADNDKKTLIPRSVAKVDWT